MIKFKNANIGKGIQGVILFLGIMGIAFYLFSVRISFLTTRTAEERLTEVAQDNVQLVNSMFGKDIHNLKKIAAYWADGKALLSNESLDYLREAGETSGYVRLTLDLPDKSTHTSDGYSTTIPNIDYLNKVFGGQNILTDLYISKIEDEPMFSVAVPVYRDREVVAALRGVYRRSVLEDFVKLQSFDGQGYINIISSNGNFLIKSNWSTEYYAKDNVFDVLKTATFSNRHSLEQMQQQLLNEESGFIEYTLSEIDRRSFFTPVGLGNWYVFATVPTEYLLREKTAIDGAAVLFLLVLCLLFGVLARYIANQNRKARILLRKDKEYLERVLNSIPLPLFISTSDRLLSFVNKEASSLFQCKHSMTGHPCHEFNTIICNTKDCAVEKIEREGTSRTFYEDKGKNYQVTTAILSGEALQDGKYIEVIQDITEIVSIQKTLEEKTLELETINENLSGGLLITSLNEGFNVISCNKGYTNLLMREENEIVNFPAFQWIFSEDLAEAKEIITRQFENGDNVYHAFRLLCGNGKRVWVSLHGNSAILNSKPVAVWLLTDISAIREATQAIKINEERYRIAMDNTEDIIIDYDVASRSMFHSDKAQEIYGVPHLVAGAPESLLHSGTVLPDSEEIYLDLFRRMKKGESKCSGNIQARASDGRILWNRLTLTSIFDSDGLPVRAIGILQDITHEKEVERQYKMETRYRKLSEPNVVLYYETNLTQRCFISGHEDLVKSFAKSYTEDFDTVMQMLVEHMVFEPDKELVQSHIKWESLMQSYGAGITRTAFEYRRTTPAGPAWVECAMQIYLDKESYDVMAIGYIKDIHEAKMQALAIQQKAERDLLTGLLNKVTAEHLIHDFTVDSSANGSKGAFLLIDLDNFKKINDTMGHAFGDDVLREISKQMKNLFGESHIVGRLGGDEFVVFVQNIMEKNEVADIAQQLCDLFHNAYVGEEQYKISGSIGIALFPENGEKFEELYKNADLALYVAKGRGKDTFAFYMP